jgi:hypothetical protein
MPIKGKVADRLQSSMLSVPGRYKVANALMLKGAWLCCVLGGVVFGLPALLIMFSVSLWQKELRHDLPYVLVLGAAGLCLDTLWLHTGVLDYGSAAVGLPLGLTLAPAWIVMLWLAVGLSIRHSLIFLVNRPLFGSLTGRLRIPLVLFDRRTFRCGRDSFHGRSAGAGRCMDWTFLRRIQLGKNSVND